MRRLHLSVAIGTSILAVFFLTASVVSWDSASFLVTLNGIACGVNLQTATIAFANWSRARREQRGAA